MQKNNTIRYRSIFALGFRKADDQIVPFTSPEPHDAILRQLERETREIDIVEAGDMFRMACRPGDEPKVTGGYLNFKRADPRIRAAMRYRLTELTKLGARQLREAVDLLKRAPVREAVEQYAQYCREQGYWPHPNDLIIQADGEGNGESEIVVDSDEIKLVLPTLDVPFPRTVNRLMQRVANRYLTVHFNRAVIGETRGVTH